MPGIRRALPIGLGLLGTFACATAPPPPAPDRYSPEQMRSGPSLQETGRFGVTPVSSNGLQIQDARPDGAAPPPPVVARHRRVKRRGRAER